MTPEEITGGGCGANQNSVYFVDTNIGVSGTTRLAIRKNPDGTYEARMGMAIMGTTNMDEEGFRKADYDPFHELFHDNYCKGVGPTEEAALAALKLDVKGLADSLWAE
jgi:hypothetical protein